MPEQPPSLEQLYARHYRRLLRFCERRMVDPHRAEEVAQEAFTQALRYFHRYDPERPMWPWLCKIAERIAHREMTVGANESPTDMVTMAFMERIAAVEAPDEAMALREAMGRLPERQRSALVLRYVFDVSATEAGETLGIDSNAFGQLLLRARRRLTAEFSSLMRDDAPDD